MGPRARACIVFLALAGCDPGRPGRKPEPEDSAPHTGRPDSPGDSPPPDSPPPESEAPDSAPRESEAPDSEAPDSVPEPVETGEPWVEECWDPGMEPPASAPSAPLGQLDLSDAAGMALAVSRPFVGNFLGTDGHDLMVVSNHTAGTYFYDDPWFTTFLDAGCWRPDRRIERDEDSNHLRDSLTWEVADLDGNEAADLITRNVDRENREYSVLVYGGPFTAFEYYGPDTADAVILGDRGVEGRVGADITTGDSDGDGRTDLLVSESGDSSYDHPGFVHLFTRPVSDTVVAVDEADTTILGASVWTVESVDDHSEARQPRSWGLDWGVRLQRKATAGTIGGGESLHGDFNADGFADAVVLGGGEDVLLAVFDGPLPTGRISFLDYDARLGPATFYTYVLPVSTGDLDGDGYDDLAMGALAGGSAGAGRIWAWRGPLDARFDLADADMTVSHDEGYAEFGDAFTTEVDLDADGRDDLIAGATFDWSPEWSGGVYVFYSPLAGAHQTAEADAVVRGTQLSPNPLHDYHGGTGNSIDPLGDINQDGFDDVVLYGRDADVPYPDTDDWLDWILLGGPR